MAPTLTAGNTTKSITTLNPDSLYRRMLKKIGKALIIVSLAGIVMAVVFIGSIFLGFFGHLPDQAALLHYKNKTASLVQADAGEVIGKFFEQNRTNISFDQIPADLINALVATEDARFFEHQGIDTRSLLRVMVKSILFSDPDAGGGSTISQQLVKNMFGRKRYGFLTMPVNKIREAIIARRLEKAFTKEEILALYLNTVSFGENIYGIEAAARRYFNKSTDRLRIEESAVLVGSLKANTAYNPHKNPESSKSRRNVVFMQLSKYKYITSAQDDSLSKLPLVLDYANLESAGPAPYFLVRIKMDARQILGDILQATGKEWILEEDGLIIKTTLNLQMQRFALEAFQEHLSVMQVKLQNQYRSAYGGQLLRAINDSLTLSDVVLHAGLFAMDPTTGAIKTWVGGINFQTNPYDQILASRQLASAFKPVIYAAAVESGILPCQYLRNDPIALEGFEDWSPNNYDKTTGGKYSVAGALAHSMNIPTVNLYLETGFDRVQQLWKKMGFAFEIYDNPSIALGTPEASIYELAVAYSAFANGGYRVKPVGIESISTPDGTLIYQHTLLPLSDRIIDEQTSQLMSAMLQKAVREGTGTSMAGVYGVTGPWAGKTGTSQNYSDAWFGAFNPGLVMVTRVGAATPAIHFSQGANGSGSTLALPLVALTLRKMERDPVTRKSVMVPFPELPPYLQGSLDCPDFKEETFIDKIISIFDPNKRISEPKKELKNQADPAVKKKKKSIFDIFRRKN